MLDVGGRSQWKGVGLMEVVDVTAGHEAGSEEGDTTTTSDDAHTGRLITFSFVKALSSSSLLFLFLLSPHLSPSASSSFLPLPASASIPLPKAVVV